MSGVIAYRRAIFAADKRFTNDFKLYVLNPKM